MAELIERTKLILDPPFESSQTTPYIYDRFERNLSPKIHEYEAKMTYTVNGFKYLLEGGY